MYKVSVVIPVYGQWEMLKRNIDALLRFDKLFINEIIVVDDRSPEPNPFLFDLDIVKILINEKNLGYSGTVNNGLKYASSDIIVLLDSDAYPIEPFIEKLLTIYDKDLTLGCVGFATIDDFGNDTGNYQHEPSVLEFVLGQQIQHRIEQYKFWGKKKLLPNSCAVSFRKSCLEEVKYFDSDLFPVLEADVDLNLAICASNWKLFFSSDIVICHKGGNSYKVNYKRVLLYHRNRWKLLKKYNKISSPILTKELLKCRIKFEILALNVLRVIKKGENGADEKVFGRKALLKEVESYK